MTLWDVHRRGARQDDLLTKLIAETRLQARTLAAAAKKIRVSGGARQRVCEHCWGRT